VSTFRSGVAAETDEHGRVLRDNVFGTREQDAARRDFTVNALYYDPATESVLDLHKGVEDLRKKTIRIIGDPATRYREDPVRMLRAVRFAAKLDFKIDAKTRAPIKSLGTLIENVPAARLFDEMEKLLLSGHAGACLHRLRAEGLHHGMLPLLDVILEQPLGEKFVNLALEQTDKRIREDRPVSPAFLFAALLWHEVLAAWRIRQKGGERGIPALYAAMDEVLERQTDKLAISRRLTATMKEIWSLQPRFEMRVGKKPYILADHPRFRAAFDFLVLRAQSGEIDLELANWWEKWQEVAPEAHDDMLVREKSASRAPTGPAGAAGSDSGVGSSAAGGEGAKRRRRRRRSGRSAEGSEASSTEGSDATAATDAAPPAIDPTR
ncbi:MAG: polynucleotide adenylyltransferase PcnB, partial [Burkholderiales bacterium]